MPAPARGRGAGGPPRGPRGGGTRGGARRGNFGGSLTKDEPTETAPDASAAPAAPAQQSSSASSSDERGQTSAPEGGANGQNHGRGNAKGKGKGKGKQRAAADEDSAGDAQSQAQTQTRTPLPAAAGAEAEAGGGADAAADADGEEDLCWICAEPIKLYSVGPCNHRTCHICAIRLRALYKVQECTFCKASLDRLIFTTSPDKDFSAFTGPDLPFSDRKLAVSFETREALADTLILLRFNCPDERCDVASAGWNDMKAHAKRDHDRLLCDLCIRNKKIFAHEHTLHTQRSLAAHMKEEHRFCEYCSTYFYSEDELFVHMRDRHEQCHICKASGNEEDRWKYFRDYNMLEGHFRKAHFLCPAKDCLEKKFVVFESEMDFKAHQVAEHSAELSSKELKEAMRIEADFRYDDPRAVGSSSGGRAGGGAGGRRGRGDRRNREPDPAPPSDPLGLSSLALRANVPGAGPANHTRRINFGGHTTSESSQQQAANALADSNSRSAAAAGAAPHGNEAERHAAYMQRVLSLLGNSESKLQSFRGAVRVFRAGEMSAHDLVDTIHSLVAEQDLDNAGVVVHGLVDLLGPTDADAERKRAILDAWNRLRTERTQFPSLAPAGASALNGFAGSNTIRNVKNRSASNNQIWANVERAAARGAPHGGARQPTATREHFPALGGSSTAARYSTSAGGSGSASPHAAGIPGSASHAAAKVRATAAAGSLKAAHGSTPWSAASSTTRVVPPAAPSPPVPYASNAYPTAATSASKLASGSGSSTPRTAPKTSSTAAFPSLPSNPSAAALAAHKRAVLGRDRDRTGAGSGVRSPASPGGTGSSTPGWGSTGAGFDGRIDSPPLGGAGRDDALDAVSLGQRLAQASVSSAGGGGSSGGGGGGGKGKKNKKGVALMSMGGVHRGL